MHARFPVIVLLAAAAVLAPCIDASAAVRLAVEVRGDASELTGPALSRLRSAGVEALAVDSRRVGPRRLGHIRRAAREASLRVIGPRATWASSVGDATDLLTAAATKTVAARVADPAAVVRLDASQLRGRFLAAIPVSTTFDAAAWEQALASTRTGPVTLVLSPSGGAGGVPDSFLQLLARTRTPQPADLYVSPAGSDDGPCTKASPCRTLDRAWTLSMPGQVVELAGGSYPAATLVATAKGSSERILFRPESGAQATIAGRLAVYGSHIEIRGLRAHDWYLRTPADDIVLRDVDVAIFAIVSATNVSILGGDVGPAKNGDPQIGQYKGPTPTGILIDGVHFHDFLKSDPSAHTECLQFAAGIDVTIRNSRFERCSDHSILVKPDQGPIRDFLIENNWFAHTLAGHYSLRLGGVGGRTCDNVLVRNNSALQEMYSNCDARNVRFVANVQPTMRKFACSSSHGAVWDWNVYGSGVPCGPNDVVAPVGFRDPDRFDLHLVPGAAAIGRGDPASVPGSDLDGDPRPLGRPDAGADERR